ncbi:MAG: hypothetical protein AAF957_06185 [Planctomycetota bacterium]
MRRSVGYALLFAWIALAGGVQLFAQAWTPHVGGAVEPALRALVPDLMTLVLVAAVGRLARRDAVALAAVAAAARTAFTASPPFAVLAGTIAVTLIADTIRRFAELDRPSLRFVAAGAGALAFGLWLLFVDLARASDARVTDRLGFADLQPAHVVLPFATAFVTAAVGLLLWPVLVQLPGLRQLERRAF